MQKQIYLRGMKITKDTKEVRLAKRSIKMFYQNRVIYSIKSGGKAKRKEKKDYQSQRKKIIRASLCILRREVSLEWGSRKPD